jgi:alkylation response protein AidB-like acyl-CoA dehydrogenase
MYLPEHPSGYISPDLSDALRKLSAIAEKKGKLQPAQLKIIYRQGWFNIWVPEMYGGLELSLPEALRIEEGLAWTDGSLGWTVTLCSGANWFVGFLQPEAAKKIFKDKKVCLAGSGKPSGIAKVTKKGYEVSGQWNYATGAPHATIFTTNCVIEENGEVVKDEAGNPLVRSFWFYKEEVTLIKNWNSVGMIATASHGFEVKKLPIPANRSFVLDTAQAVLPHPVYHFPFLQFAEATLAVNYAGMAIHFMDLCQVLFGEKMMHQQSRAAITPELIQLLEKCILEINNARGQFYAAVDKAWESHQSLTPELLQAISSTSRSLSATARKLVDHLYPWCGLVAANPTSEINRVWRDLHTASQHTLLLFPYEATTP